MRCHTVGFDRPPCCWHCGQKLFMFSLFAQLCKKSWLKEKGNPMRKLTSYSWLLAAASIGVVALADASGYRVIKTIPVGGEGGWDYVYVDSNARRVYVAHATHTVVLDADNYAVVGDIPDTAGVHGIAIAPELGRGFTSNGHANDVTIFDLKTLKTLGTIKTDQNPDAILYEPVSKRIFTFNGGGKNATVINAVDGLVVGTIPLGGKPEFAVQDGKGHIFVNIESTSEIVELDALKAVALQRWPITPCKAPTGLAMDEKNRRLFAVGDDNIMVVINADTGKVLATLTIGEGPDAAGYDPVTHLVFASNGEGTLSVFHQDSPDKYTLVENVPTQRSARTMSLDLKTHRVFLPAADVTPPAVGQRRGKVTPGSFAILVVGN